MAYWTWQIEKYLSRLGPDSRDYAEELIRWYRKKRYVGTSEPMPAGDPPTSGMRRAQVQRIQERVKHLMEAR